MCRLFAKSVIAPNSCSDSLTVNRMVRAIGWVLPFLILFMADNLGSSFPARQSRISGLSFQVGLRIRVLIFPAHRLKFWQVVEIMLVCRFFLRFPSYRIPTLVISDKVFLPICEAIAKRIQSTTAIPFSRACCWTYSIIVGVIRRVRGTVYVFCLAIFRSPQVCS